jgi:branched-chain amino acid aminotransferase
MAGKALFNGAWIDASEPVFRVTDRSVLYGDGVFETIRSFGTEGIRFWEAHYFRLMASMRLLRMRIPDAWSPEFLLNHLIEVAAANSINSSDVRIRLSVWRKGEAGYGTRSSEVDWSLAATALDGNLYTETSDYSAVVFKEFTKAPGALAGLKGPHSFLYTQSERFALEMEASESLVLTHDNRLLEGGKSNLFLVFGSELVTAPLSAGCIRGIVREQVLKQATSLSLSVREETLSPFELQRADEVWLTNAIVGLQSLSHYKQTRFANEQGKRMRGILEDVSRESSWL